MLFKGSYGKNPAVQGSAVEVLPFRLLITKVNPTSQGSYHEDSTVVFWHRGP